MPYGLGIPYRQVLRAGCPALVDSHANTVKVAGSTPVAARVFLHNRFIAIIHYRHIYPGKPFSSDQYKQMRQNRMERREVANLCCCRGWGSGYKERCLLTCLHYTPVCELFSKTMSKVLSTILRRQDKGTISHNVMKLKILPVIAGLGSYTLLYEYAKVVSLRT